jgi:hypothetical protein
MPGDLLAILQRRPLCLLPEKDCLFRCAGHCCHGHMVRERCPLFASRDQTWTTAPRGRAAGVLS